MNIMFYLNECLCVCVRLCPPLYFFLSFKKKSSTQFKCAYGVEFVHIALEIFKFFNIIEETRVLYDCNMIASPSGVSW